MGKFYAVRNGRKTGIFTSWDECREQTDGFPSAEFKSFVSRDEAERYIEGINSEKNESDYDYIAYSDGGCVSNPGGRGGYGVVIINAERNTEREYSGGFVSTTNNRMEIFGAIEALRHIPEGSRVLLRTDSAYVVNTMTKNWNRGANNDLWERLDEERAKRNVDFEWVKAHAGDRYNERCDGLATEAYNSEWLMDDTGYLPVLDERAEKY